MLCCVGVAGMLHSLVGFLFDVITCQMKWNKKEEKVRLNGVKILMQFPNIT